MSAKHLHRPFCSQQCKRPSSLRTVSLDRKMSVKVFAAKPVLMVNSCTGKMGRSVAEAAVRAGLELVPYTLCGAQEAADTPSIEVSGRTLQLVGPDTRDDLIQQVPRYCRQLSSCASNHEAQIYGDICIELDARPVHSFTPLLGCCLK